MPIILQIETSTQVCSAAIAADGKTLALKETEGSNIHASNLTLFIDEIMKECRIGYKELDAIAVSKGPGSYTGLRIGVSTAKGLCFALDKPLIAIDTLEMMANGYFSQHPADNNIICPMIDARRMEVYCALYNSNLDILRPIEATIVDHQTFLDRLNLQQIVFIGNGAKKCEEVINHKHAAFIEENYNSANYLSSLALKSFENEIFEDVAYFEPFYLKDFVLTTPKKKI